MPDLVTDSAAIAPPGLPLPLTAPVSPLPATNFVSSPQTSTTPSTHKHVPFLWISLLIVAITAASAGTYYYFNSRTPTATSAGPITDIPKNPVTDTINPFNDQAAAANPFATASATEDNPFAPATSPAGDQAYQNPFSQ